MNGELIALARAAAARHRLDASVVCGVIEQESAWDPRAMRYEPSFRTRYVAPLRLPATEEIARSISWGLMQVMGQVAREQGFRGKFLTELCEPSTGVEIGCSVLAIKLGIAHGDVRSGLELWNGGANPNYSQEVLAKTAHYRAL
jgi:soluble lytic murein transglycosylase-like protein